MTRVYIPIVKPRCDNRVASFPHVPIFYVNPTSHPRANSVKPRLRGLHIVAIAVLHVNECRSQTNKKPRKQDESRSGYRDIAFLVKVVKLIYKAMHDTVLGRGGAQPGAGSGGSSDRRKTEEDAKAEQIRANLEAARGPSLYAEHQRREGGKGGRIEAEEDDPSKRAFDWGKDMSSGSKIGTAQRRELMNKAADFGGRFSKGKYL